MFFNFSFKSTFLFVFFFHGIVFSILLLLKGIQNKNKSTLWLSLAVFLSTLYIFPFMCGYGGWYSRTPYRDILFYIPFQQVLLLPPVLYLYIKSLLDTSFVFTRKDFVNFLPAIGYLVYSLVILLTDKVILNQYYFYKDERDKDFADWYQAAGFVSLFCYLIASLKVYYHYRKITYQFVSFADTILFSWIQRFLYSFLILLLLRAIFFISNPEWGQFGNKFWYYLCFSFLFYYISISGYVNYLQSIISFRHSSVFAQPQVQTTYSDQDRHNHNRNSMPTREEIYQGSPEFELLKDEIEQLMITEKLFKNQELTLTDLSERVGSNSKKVSQVINQGFNMNFNDFVNIYRTREVIEILQSNKSDYITLLGIALDCGFNSKSTFNRAFKKHTALTPKEYMEKYKPK